MASEERIAIPRLEGHSCFACGPANPIGLNLRFYGSGNSVCTDITLGKNYVGWENMAHGGIISTILDEVMAWTILYYKRTFFVTRTMEVRYLKPVMIDTPLLAKGRLLGKERGSIVEVMGEIFNSEGKVMAKGVGEFVMLSKEQLHLVPEGVKNDMLSLFEKLPPLSGKTSLPP